jgi:hypothetical protein
MAESVADLVGKLTALIELAIEVRDALASSVLRTCEIDADLRRCDDDLEPLIDTCAASARFNLPQDTLRKWARREGCGVRRGGRWLISVPRVRKRLGL